MANDVSSLAMSGPTMFLTCETLSRDGSVGDG